MQEKKQINQNDLYCAVHVSMEVYRSDEIVQEVQVLLCAKRNNVQISYLSKTHRSMSISDGMLYIASTNRIGEDRESNVFAVRIPILAYVMHAEFSSIHLDT